MRIEKILVFIIPVGLIATGFFTGYSNQRHINVISLPVEKPDRQFYSFPIFESFDIKAFLSRIFPETITPEEIKRKYQSEKVRILLVPGHDNIYTGAVFGDLKETELNVLVAGYLYELFKKDSRFEVIIARNLNGGFYTKEFGDYFNQQRNSILSFMKERKDLVKNLLDAGDIKENVAIEHNFAPGDTAVKLYGINKWANENDIDLSLHIHFNDDPSRKGYYSGEYSGLAIYVPEEQYSNARASKDIASSLLNELKQYFPLSNNPLEKGTVIEAQELIALGSNASQEGAALLLEYGYIYEARFLDPKVREKVFGELAFQTYQGIKKYFDPNYLEPGFQTSLLPHKFRNNLKRGLSASVDVLALQAALHEQKLYPPPERDLGACPINGNFGPCTERAVALFQERYKKEVLTPTDLFRGTGFVGSYTLKKLNELYSLNY